MLPPVIMYNGKRKHTYPRQKKVGNWQFTPAAPGQLAVGFENFRLFDINRTA